MIFDSSGYDKYRPLLNGNKPVGGDEIASHFTDMRALCGVLEFDEMWCTHISFMNDPYDGTMLIKKLLSLIEKHIASTKYKSDFDKYISSRKDVIYPSSWLEISFIDLSSFDGLIYYIYRRIFRKLSGIENGHRIVNEKNYLLSFVRTPSDDAHHWMTYGDDGFGVRIDFNMEKFLGSLKKEVGVEYYYNECIYITEEELNEISICIFNDLKAINLDGISEREIDLIIENLFLLSIYTKHISYHCENESRLVFGGYFSRERLGHLISKGNVKPYRKLGFEVNSIHEICLGPRADLRARSGLAHLINSKIRDSKTNQKGKINNIALIRSNTPYVGKPR